MLFDFWQQAAIHSVQTDKPDDAKFLKETVWKLAPAF